MTDTENKFSLPTKGNRLDFHKLYSGSPNFATLHGIVIGTETAPQPNSKDRLFSSFIRFEKYGLPTNKQNSVTSISFSQEKGAFEIKNLIFGADLPQAKSLPRAVFNSVFCNNKGEPLFPEFSAIVRATNMLYDLKETFPEITTAELKQEAETYSSGISRLNESGINNLTLPEEERSILLKLYDGLKPLSLLEPSENGYDTGAFEKRSAPSALMLCIAQITGIVDCAAQEHARRVKQIPAPIRCYFGFAPKDYYLPKGIGCEHPQDYVLNNFLQKITRKIVPSRKILTEVFEKFSNPKMGLLTSNEAEKLQTWWKNTAFPNKPDQPTHLKAKPTGYDKN